MSIRNPVYDDYFPILIFLVTIVGTMSVAMTRALMGLGPPDPKEELLGQLLSQNRFSEI